jgi:hypothetical protein
VSKGSGLRAACECAAASECFWIIAGDALNPLPGLVFQSNRPTDRAILICFGPVYGPRIGFWGPGVGVEFGY